MASDPGETQTIPLHCNEVYFTPPSVAGEQSRTVFFTLDPRRATARMSSRQTDSSRGRQTAMKWAWKRRGSPAERTHRHRFYQTASSLW